MPDRPAITDVVGNYYTGRLREHGVSPAGVDWNGQASQRLRFEQLLRACPAPPYSLNDYGCGYGALAAELPHDIEYCGFDISEEMIAAALATHGARPRTRFTSRLADVAVADVTVASGIFSVRLQFDDIAWREHILSTLDVIDGLSRRSFAFNMLTSYSDADLMRSDLYYADPAFYFDHCKRHYARNVALLHDYELYEFTLIVRKA